MNNGTVVYEAMSGQQVLPSSELIRELEELSLNKVSSPSPSPAPSETASSRASNTTPTPELPALSHSHNPSIDILSTLESVQEKRAGILKPQALTSDEGGNSNRTRSRQNVAMQAILRRSQEQETKQVTFKTPSPPPPAPIPAPVIAPPIPPTDWRNNINMNRQLPQHPPPAFPYPPPSIDNRNFHKIPPPTPSRPMVNNHWPEEPRTPTWWQPPEEPPYNGVPPPRSLPFGMNPAPVQAAPSNDVFNNSLSFKSPFSTMFSQPPPFSPQHSETVKPQVVEPPLQTSSLVSPTYSLFSPAWTAPHHPPPPVASLMGQQSLWFGPGPSPLERLLEQQKQLREGPTPHSDAT